MRQVAVDEQREQQCGGLAWRQRRSPSGHGRDQGHANEGQCGAGQDAREILHENHGMTTLEPGGNWNGDPPEHA
ncbi:MAG: hypothetical protein VB142_07545 [Burkholderia sp.]